MLKRGGGRAEQRAHAHGWQGRAAPRALHGHTPAGARVGGEAHLRGLRPRAALALAVDGLCTCECVRGGGRAGWWSRAVQWDARAVRAGRRQTSAAPNPIQPSRPAALPLPGMPHTPHSPSASPVDTPLKVSPLALALAVVRAMEFSPLPLPSAEAVLIWKPPVAWRSRRPRGRLASGGWRVVVLGGQAGSDLAPTPAVGGGGLTARLLLSRRPGRPGGPRGRPSWLQEVLQGGRMLRRETLARTRWGSARLRSAAMPSAPPTHLQSNSRT